MTFRRFAPALSFLITLARAAAVQAAVPYAVLHTFTDPADGTYIGGQLAIGSDYAYGTALNGGTTDDGTLYRINLQTNQFNVLYNFGQTTTDPINPYNDSVILSGGILYGVSELGGDFGNGSLYQYDLATSQLTVLHSLASDFSEGAFPVQTTLTQSGSILYGVTHYGGSSGFNGVVFKFDTTTNTYAVLHALTGNQGNDPLCKLALSGNFLYGTAQDGGSSGDRTIYKIDATTGAYTLLHTFTGAANDGKFPWGDAVIVSGNSLLGMTQLGGTFGKGTIYSFDLTTNQMTILHSFSGAADDGSQPFQADLLQEGDVLFGVTGQGGADGDGVVFQFNLDTNQFDVLHNFSTIDDADPRTTLVRSGDYLYGLSNAGNTDGAGAIFSLYIPPVPELSTVFLLTLATLPFFARNRRYRSPTTNQSLA